MSFRTVALAAAFGLAVSPAFAAMKAPDAEMHFKAIASGNVTNIMSQYAPDASLLWVGGPLDGSYAGTKSIQSLWQKFSKANGKLTDKVTNIVVGTDPKGMTVTANVDFMGQGNMSKMKIPVRYVLTYRNGKIVDEIWQLAPSLKTM